MKYSETKIEELLENITIHQFGRGCYLLREVEEADKQAAREGLQKCRLAPSSGAWDGYSRRGNNCAAFRTVSTDELLNTLAEKAVHTEVILTGRLFAGTLRPSRSY